MTGYGTNSSMIWPMLLALPFLFNRIRITERLKGLTSRRRLLLVVTFVFLVAVQFVQWDSWRTHRDALGILIVFCIAGSLENQNELSKVVQTYVVILCVFFFTLYSFLPDFALYEVNRFGGPYHPNETALLAAMGVAAIAWIDSGSRISRILLIAALFAIIFICGSRVALVIAVGTIIDRILDADFILKTNIRWGIRAALSLSSLAILIVFSNLWQPWWTRGAELWHTLKLGGRTVFWPEYLELSLIEPLFGLGDHGLHTMSVTSGGHVIEAVHAHNSILYVAVMNGAPVMVGLFALLLLGANNGRLILKRSQRTSMSWPHTRAAFVIVCASTIAGLLEPMTIMASTSVGAISWFLIFTYFLRMPLPGYELRHSHTTTP